MEKEVSAIEYANQRKTMVVNGVFTLEENKRLIKIMAYILHKNILTT